MAEKGVECYDSACRVTYDNTYDDVLSLYVHECLVIANDFSSIQLDSNPLILF